MTRRARTFVSALAFATAATFVVLPPLGRLPRARATPAVVTRTIRVKLSTTGQDISFDQTRLELPLVKTIRLRYENDAPVGSAISHNVAIIRPERVSAVLATLQEHDYDLSAVRGSRDILAITHVLAPGESETISFSPPGPGEYVYICLMPGHGDMLGMRGTLLVRP